MNRFPRKTITYTRFLTMGLSRGTALLSVAAIAALMAGCGAQPLARSDAHLGQQTAPPAAPAATPIPQPVRPAPLPPPPEARASEIKYSIVVANQPVRDVLLAIARETRVNVDVHPGVEGAVTLNAIDQTLKQILTRIAKQIDMRFEIEEQTIHVMPDTPYLKNYRVDYVNMSRDATETVSISTQVISGALGTTGAAAPGAGDNNSTLRIANTSRNRFWESLERNIKDILRETDKLLPEGSSETFVSGRGQTGVATTQASVQRRAGTATTAAGAVAGAAGALATTPGQTQTQQAGEYVEQRLTFREAASVIVNPESGIVTVRATSRQHEKVAEFLEQVSGAAKRQVVIAATVVEVSLSDQYQSGVDWSALATNGLGYSIQQSLLGSNLSTPPFFSLTYNNPNPASGGNVSSTIKFLSQFGKTRVLSSPLLMVLNNQTAVLKVTDNIVYFTIKADTNTNANVSTTTFTTTQNVVPVGFIMNITAQISESDVVTLSVRPTITSVVKYVQDPNPSLRATLTQPAIQSLIPETRTREMESVLRVASGQIAVLGGLMEDSFEGARDGIPHASRIPLFGDLFSYRNDKSMKKELVIFLRPLVVRNASIDGDLAGYRRFLPDDNFFRDTRPPAPEFQEMMDRIERGEMPRGEPQPLAPAPPPAAELPR
jgi:general secretion pathway protein D